jgi:hypothetical protein
MRLPPSLPVVLGVLLAGPCLAAENADPRHDLERLELVLAQAVDRVSRPSAFPVLAAGACRGYRIQGLGAVFVLPPRALFAEGESRFVFHVGEPPPPEVPRRHPTRGKARALDPREAQIRSIETQVEAFQREAERSRQEAEAALDQLEQQIRIRLAPRPEIETVNLPEAAEGTRPPRPPQPAPTAATLSERPTPAVAPLAPLPPLPPAPWRYWFQSSDEEELRSAAQIVADVRSAVTDALEAEGAAVTILRPDELLVAAVDFVSGPVLAPGERPARTLILRVRKKDLEERKAGKLSADELRKRIEYAEY